MSETLMTMELQLRSRAAMPRRDPEPPVEPSMAEAPRLRIVNLVSEVKRVYDELIRDMTLDQSIKLCNAVYSKRYNFLNFRIGAEPSKYMTLNFEHGL
jgi:hypothetical protein